MAFEIFNKKIRPSGIQSNEISFGKSGITFGENATKDVLKFSHCEVYFDKQNNRVGFKPSNDKIKGFAIGKTKESNRSYLTGVWANELQKGKFKYSKEDGFLVVENCLIKDEDKNTDEKNNDAD